MAIATVAELIAALRQYQLLTPEQLEEAAGHAADVRTLSQMLIEIGWLTAYQVQQLLDGRGQELVLGSYLVLESVGQGGMGQVFKARHRGLDKIVALKLIHKERLDNPNAVKRFRREIQAAAKLNHPNVVVAYDADQIGNTHFFTMEHVDGADLAKIVEERCQGMTACATERAGQVDEILVRPRTQVEACDLLLRFEREKKA